MINDLGQNLAATGGVAETALNCASGGTNPDYENYGYDPNSNRTTLRVRSGQQITFAYDNPNREEFKDIPNETAGDVNTGYDLAGRRRFARFTSPTSDTISVDCTANNPGIDYCYDTAGRLIYETSYGRRLAFAYQDKINRTHLTYPLFQGQGTADFIEYVHDALNRMDQVQENGVATGAQLLADYSYDPLSRRTGISRSAGPTPITTVFGYDNASRLIQLDHDVPSGADYDQQLDFGYSPASQITSRTAANESYNWTTAAFDIDYARNGLNQYTAVDGVSYTHDARGNLTGDGARLFCYDLENRLTGVANAGGNACTAPTFAISYDPLGRLRQTTQGAIVTQFLYDGDRLAAEYASASPTAAPLRRYVHGAGVDEPLVWYEGAALDDTTRRWLIANHQGSVVADTNAAGAASRYLYGSYGEPGPEGWGGSRFRYTGQIVIGDGNVRLYHYKARVYDPALGRFLQTDPIGYEDDYNLYAYVGNDPLNNTDPTGRCAGPVAAPCVGVAVVVGLVVRCAVSAPCRNLAIAWGGLQLRKLCERSASL